MSISLEHDTSIRLSDDEHEDWYCICIKPFRCEVCYIPICYLECGAHHIIVWEEKDDQQLLTLAAALQFQDREPRIDTYKNMLGPCVTWEKGIELGWIKP